MNELPIFASYTRAEALEDGVLVDVTTTAKEAGSRYPVALTRAVFEKYVRVPNGVSCQDEDGRLWDILNMLLWGIRRAKGKNSDCVRFTVHVAQAEGARPTSVELKALCGPGDEAEPVITVMLPDED